jgi:Transposase DDE domain
MAYTIAQIVGQFKADVAKVLLPATIEAVCQSVGYSWRDRILTPVITLHAFLLQVLHGNMACSGVSRLIGTAFSAAAYCDARMRLPTELFEQLLQRIGQALSGTLQDGRWHGHRTWIMDGSSFSMPDTPALQEHFGQPGAQADGCGFPVAHMLVLFHAGLGFLQRVIAAPLRTHDMAQAATLHPEMAAGDILLGDRGLASFAHLALLSQRKLHGVFRGHQKQIVSFRSGRKHTKQRKPQKGLPRSRWLRRLGHWDQLVEYSKPKNRPKWMNAEAYAALPETLVVRELRYVVTQKGRRTKVITLVTTLLDPKAYPASELAALYERRWQAEVNLRHLKTTMGMEVLRCQTVAGVTKELYVFALVYNLVRLVMLEAAKRQQVPVERISFVDALRWLQSAQPGTPLTPLVVNPERRHRFEPRVCKRRPKHYRLMNKPRAQLRKALERHRHAA